MLPEKAIDVHAHFLPRAYRDALRSNGFRLLDGGMPIPEWSAQQALDLMDEVGLTAAMLSVSSPFATTVAGADAASLCRKVNDYAAELKSRYPTRFGALAMLPVPDVAASLDEIGRALDDLALDGVALPTNAAGLYLGDPALAPVLAALDERQATVFVHPTSPCCFEKFGLALPAPMIEFPFDTTRSMTSLLYSSASRRYEGIKFIFSHGGGTMPFLAPRIARVGASPVTGDRSRPVQESLDRLRSWHYDLASVTTPAQVEALRTMVPASQILFGTDYPFSPAPSVRLAVQAFPTLPFPSEDRRAILHGNAARLFPPFAKSCGCTID